VGRKGDCKDDKVGLDRVLNPPGDDRSANLRRARVQRSFACHDHFHSLARECLGDSRPDLAKPDDCVAH
jgi:hypothetical protein